jgi:hypothetical protein
VEKMPAIFRSFVAVNLLLFTQPTFAQKISATPSTGDYATDLGALNGAMRTAGFTRDICLEAFPDMQPVINDAYNTWSERYKPFLQELAMRMNLLLLEDARQTGISVVQEMAAYTTELAKLKPTLRALYSKDGPTSFKTFCESYPRTLLGDGVGNIQKHYPEHVATIRKVPIQ